MSLLTIAMSSFVRRKKSLGAFQAILCFFGVVLFSSMCNAAEITQVTLAWDPSDDPNVAGYNVYCRTTGRTYGGPIGTVANVPNPELPLTLEYGKKYYCVVTAYDTYGNESPPSSEVSWPIQVISPNGGEIIATGETYPIQWYADPQAVRFKLLFSMNKGKSWIDINQDDYVINTSYDWLVPALRGNKKACLIRVIGYDNSNRKVGDDRSDARFRTEVIKLTTPNGGEEIASTYLYTINWETNETIRPVDKVSLFLSNDGGSTWLSIVSLAGNPESYEWTVPKVSKRKSKCKIKIALKDAAGFTVGSDISSAYFTINP